MKGSRRISWRTLVVVALVALVGFALFAIDRRVDSVLTRSLNSSAEQGASATAKTLADFALTERELQETHLGPTAKAELTKQLRDSSAILSARLWAPNGKLVLDTAFHRDEGTPPEGVLAAFDGTGTTRLTSGAEELEEAGLDPSKIGTDKQFIEVYLPIAPAGGSPSYVIEAFLAYEPASGLIANAHHSLDVLLAAASAFLFLALSWLIIRTARLVVPPGRDFRLERRLRRALHAGQVEAFFQPKIALRSGEILGVEALVRWRQSDGTVMPPDEFLPPIQNSDAMHDLTLAVLDQSIAQLAHWRAQGLDIGSVAINIPSQSLLSAGFEDEVRAALERYRVVPRKLTLELTEASIVDQPELAAERIAALRGVGVDVSIDDFGTRHSSLARISHFAVTELKIDRSFVSGMRHSEADLAVVKMVIDLGKALGLRVVAEGIETDEDAAALTVMGCPIGQGYLYARPMPGTDICEWALRYREASAQPSEGPMASGSREGGRSGVETSSLERIPLVSSPVG
jgi:EAL domain-containing protein (putative c-di-GMP-specific phosphodiesterase class I)